MTSTTRNQLAQLIRLGLVGATGFAIDVVVFAAALALGAHHLVAATAAFVIAMASNFACNRHWTFGVRRRSAGAPGRALRSGQHRRLPLRAGGRRAPHRDRRRPRARRAARLDRRGDAAELRRQPGLGVRRPGARHRAAHDARSRHCAHHLARRPHLQRGREHRARSSMRCCRSWPRPPASTGCSSSMTPRPTAPATSPTGSPPSSSRSRVLHRTEKNGLGRAYAAGFARALAGGAELVIQMDADFSHDPKHIPALIEAAAEADLVLGSRYVAGGGVDELGPLPPSAQPRRLLVRAHRPRPRRSGTSPAASSASGASCSSASSARASRRPASASRSR